MPSFLATEVYQNPIQKMLFQVTRDNLKEAGESALATLIQKHAFKRKSKKKKTLNTYYFKC